MDGNHENGNRAATATPTPEHAPAPDRDRARTPITLNQMLLNMKQPIPPESIQHRPLKKDGPAILPYITWQECTRLLDKRTQGRWHTEAKVFQSGDLTDPAAVSVTLTIGAPDIGQVSRTALAQHRSSHENSPSVEGAAASALKRAAALFGMDVPETAQERPRPTATGNKETDDAAAAGETVPLGRPCGNCGLNHSGRFSNCYACHLRPDRTPGVCAECGAEGISPQYATCYQCKDNS